MEKSPITLTRLKSFGDVAAEDDAVLDYFLKIDAVARITRNEAFLVLGRKGAGKTAIVRYFTEGEGRAYSKALNLRGYPWNIHAQRVDRGASEIEAYVSTWRYLISLQLATLAVSRAKSPDHPQAKAVQRFLKDNYGGADPVLGDLLKPGRLRLSSLSFEPQVLGFKLGGIDLERSKEDLQLGSELNALSDLLLRAAIVLATEARLPALLVHCDELDQGLSIVDDRRSRMLIGLLLAARAVRHASKDAPMPVTPVVYLRTDLWDELRFSDRNKISETLTLHLGWDSHSLMELVDARLSAKLAPSVRWADISTADQMRGSQSKWNHILNRTFLRPRDVIKFLNAALAQAKKRFEEPLVLVNEDVTGARPNYSSYLKAELDDEIMAHWAQWEEALQACSAISTVTFQRDEFVREYERRRSPQNQVGADDALQLLYRFSVIGYERRSGYGGSSWAFQYTHPEAGWDGGALRFKVHLGLKEYAKLREERIGGESDE